SELEVLGPAREAGSHTIDGALEVLVLEEGVVVVGRRLGERAQSVAVFRLLALLERGLHRAAAALLVAAERGGETGARARLRRAEVGRRRAEELQVSKRDRVEQEPHLARGAESLDQRVEHCLSSFARERVEVERQEADAGLLDRLELRLDRSHRAFA